jgi:hypothetical protein
MHSRRNTRRFGAIALFTASTLVAASALVIPATGASGSIHKVYDQLTPGDGSAGDEYGAAVAISGSTAVVGSWKHDSTAGTVYIYVKSAGVWSQQAELTEPGGETAGDYFGDSVAIDKNIVVVGAFGRNSGLGEAYVYVRTGSTWAEGAALTPSNGTASDGFGVSVGVSGNTVVVGANQLNDLTGAAYVYAKSGGTWVQKAELTASDGQDNDTFGYPVSISGNLILVGAQGHNSYTGSAYVFAKGPGGWQQQAELTASDGSFHDNFGIGVSISGTTALIGSIGNGNDAGAAYLFIQSGTTWSQQAEVTASNGSPNSDFGQWVALSGTTALVGNEPSGGGGKPAAYVFTQSGATWPQTLILKPPNTDVNGGWFPVALSGDTAIIGAWLSNGSIGSAYVTK